MATITLLIKEMVDTYLRENIQRISDFINQEVVLSARFKLLTITDAGVQTNLKVAHNLGYTPKDVIVTSAIGSAGYTLNYSLFDSTNIDLDITGSGTKTLRLLVGSFQ